MALRMRRLCDRLATFPAPVIAALNGHALGGGAEVSVAADIRVAAADATIAFNQSKLAIMPAWGGAERLAGIVGRPQALLLTTTGERIDAVEAHRIGLLDRVYPRESFESVLARPGGRHRGVPGPGDQEGHRGGRPASSPVTREGGSGAVRGLVGRRRSLGSRRRGDEEVTPDGRTGTGAGRSAAPQGARHGSSASRRQPPAGSSTVTAITMDSHTSWRDEVMMSNQASTTSIVAADAAVTARNGDRRNAQ